MPSLESGKVHACACPLTQGLPFLARQAFGVDENVLRPVVSFKEGWGACRPEFERVAERLGFTSAEGGRAFDRAIEHHRAFLDGYRRRGREVLAEMRDRPDRLYVGLFGRPYNAFTRDANMGIPRKFTSRGVSVVPFDMIYDEAAPIFPNMYWYYGQQNMKAVARVKETENLYLTWISNFSCAPDSFMLHYLRWMMGEKPYLVLEIDSHTADAGLDTRIEAFLDIVDELPAPGPPPRARPGPGAATASTPRADRPRSWTRAAASASPCATRASRSSGRRSATSPLPRSRRRRGGRACTRSTCPCRPPARRSSPATWRRARSASRPCSCSGASSSSCERRAPRRPDEALVVAIPSTLGPCRTGQYHVFYDRLFDELGLDNVAQLVAGDESSYGELGPGFVRDLWRAILVSDYFTDVRTALRLLARDADSGRAVFERTWSDVVAGPGAGSARAAPPRSAARGPPSPPIPRRRSLADVKKVLVVGEIYVRRDSFSVRELSEHLVAQGIFPKLASISEWIHYTDWARTHEMDAARRQDGWLGTLRRGVVRRAGRPGRRDAGGSTAWSGRCARPWRRRVSCRRRPTTWTQRWRSEAAPSSPPSMQSEATVSPAVAAAAMRDGYSGVAIIAPFGCLPGRVIEGVYAPWARAHGYPVVALENDGQPYPPNVVSRLEVFAQNVERYERQSGRA